MWINRQSYSFLYWITLFMILKHSMQIIQDISLWIINQKVMLKIHKIAKDNTKGTNLCCWRSLLFLWCRAQMKMTLFYQGARCSSVVRAFTHDAMGRRIDPSWWTYWAISRSSQCSTTGVTKAVVCVILSGMMHIKEPLLLIGKNSPCGGSGFPLSCYLNSPLPYVWRHITINKMCWVHH